MDKSKGATPILEVRDLHKAYGKVKAVDGISFAVREGSCFGILGPNGAGKTTAIEVIETIHEPDSGTILYRGEVVARSFKENIGIQFQDTSLQEFLTVRETLELFSKLYPKPRPLAEIIEACSLEEFIDRDNRKLSGGQRQRMLLGIALVNDPDLLFLDEPTTGLDPHARRNFWRLVEGIKAQGKTVILTTHYMDEAEYLCEDIIVMDHGHIIEAGKPRELLLKHFGEAVIRVPRGGRSLRRGLQMPRRPRGRLRGLQVRGHGREPSRARGRRRESRGAIGREAQSRRSLPQAHRIGVGLK